MVQSSLLLLLSIFCACDLSNQESTRGIGIYPGNPAEDFSPELNPNMETYRNIARLRPAYHSSSYDYNLTAQLVTDGIITEELPSCITLETSQGMVPKNEREWVLDHVTGSGISIDGGQSWFQLGIVGGNRVPEVSRIVINGSVTYDEEKPAGYRFSVVGSLDGQNWQELARSAGSGLPGYARSNPFARRRRDDSDTTRPRFDFFADFMGPRDPGEPEPSFSFSFGQGPPRRNLSETFEFTDPATFRYYRVILEAPAAMTWTIGDFDFYYMDEQVEMAPSHRFTSAWMGAGSGEEWIDVDLGSSSLFDQVALHWEGKTRPRIEVTGFNLE